MAAGALLSPARGLHAADEAQPAATNGQPAAMQLHAVTVVGVRASLATALDVKQDKVEIVDSVVAQDINKLPDFSVTDALQRVTGVQIGRERGEGTGVAIRGLTQTETTLNGREIFTAGWVRNLDFSDFPAELVSRIDVYKTSSADHLEGGIGGTVDLRTRRPFDFSGAQTVATARMVYGDFVDTAKPQFSLLASNRWETGDGGEFGALINVAWQKRAWREDLKSTNGPVPLSVSGRTVYAPGGAQENLDVGERERSGLSTILQWRPRTNLEFYAEAHHAEFKTRQNSHQLNITANGSRSFDADSVILFPGTSDVKRITWTNASVQTLGFSRDTVDRTTQVAVGGSWKADALTLRTDLSHTRSYNGLDFTSVNLNGTAARLTQDLSEKPPATSVSGTDLLDPSSYGSATMFHASRPFEGRLTAWQADAEYRVTKGFLHSLAGGIRLARREADNGPGQTVFVGSASTANAAGLIIANPYSDYFPGSTSVRRYLLADPDETRGDADALRQRLGISGTIPTSNPAGIWEIREDTISSYLIARVVGTTLPVDGNVGVRVVQTRSKVAGFQLDSSTGSLTPLDLDDSYVDTLPSANLRYELAPGLYLRGAASKTLTRPNFDKIAPSITLNPARTPPEGSAGNPELRPIRSTNFDVALEKYVGASTAVYLTVFRKKVDGFIATVTGPELHDGVVYQITRPQNTDTGDIKGAEIGYQQFFDFLPGWLSGLGIQANYTYVDSKTPSSLLGQDTPLEGLSKHSYNLVGMYEKGRLTARLAYNWRDDYLLRTVNVAGLGALPVYAEAYGWLDASLSYRVSKQLTLALEGTNLLDTERHAHYGTKNRPQSSWKNDVQVSATATVRF